MTCVSVLGLFAPCNEKKNNSLVPPPGLVRTNEGCGASMLL